MNKQYNFDEFQMAYDNVIDWINRCDLGESSTELFIEAVDHLVEVLKDAK